MTQTFTGSVSVNVTGVLTSSSNLGSSGYNLSYPQTVSYSNGTSTNQANMVWSDTRTLAASATENIDLAGVLTNAFGTTISFTAIKGIIISAASGNTNNVLVGGHATAAFVNWVSDYTDQIVVQPGGTFCLMTGKAAGYPVTATTGDLLKITNSSSGTSVTYDIVLIGNV